MSDPVLALQDAIITALRADAAVQAIVAQRVYDQAPAGPTFPYTTLGPAQVLPNDADCYRGSEIHLQIDTWSRATGYPETRRLTGAIRDVLHHAALVLTDHRLVQLTVDAVRHLPDPDGTTKHGVVSLLAFTEPST